ncbi:MAG: SPOR domain-containing protein [Candidatus Thiodiazotropha taylori]|nr:SPOR domain-containing protein [Candidatus Thiodiazotropha taylori]MCW4226885.1 SPOR domain-containing protein [Candidatus Thiodiazotropha endolucinida]MCG7882099.1 SPOR domain-containing protein [Candidatus Thiodiazotropha taylori]MCG7888447.1 SPOR domain-containing protein [Candidatus Thiodiazotropha taylori]MCG7890757.1 SPOR domain-containing protein [Candidatus Thiodiazotropha taylori]
MKKKNLKKKELAVRMKRLVDQFSDLNNRLNRVSHDKLNQGLKLDQLSEANSGMQLRLQEMQSQIGQLISQEEELSSLLDSLRLQASDRSSTEESRPEQQETQRNIDYLNEQLASLHEQQQAFKQALERDSEAADATANETDDLRRDITDLLSHIRRLEESGSELLISDSNHESQIQSLQNDIAELSHKQAQSQTEQGEPPQEVSQLLQESAQPLRDEIEQLRHQLTEKGGQQKELERRLLELANRIGETGARLESQQQDKARNNDLLEQRLSKLENLVKGFEPVSNADASQLLELERKLNQAEQDMTSLLADKDRELAARLDSIDGALNEQAVKHESFHDRVNHLSSDLADSSRSLQEQLASTDLRLSSYLDQQADLPDPLTSISTVIEEQRERFEEAVNQLKGEISGLQSKLQVLDMDEHEAAERLSSLATDLDQQAGNREQLQESVTAAKSEINRRVDEIEARLVNTERLFKEGEAAAQDQLHKLNGVAEEMIEQSRHGVDLKLTTAALQEDASGLKERTGKLSERLDAFEQTLHQGEQKQTQISQQLSVVEQDQKELREFSDLGIDSLQERVKTVLAQLTEQSGLNEGLSQRLDDLESSLQAQFKDIDSRHHQLLETESETRDRLQLQEQNSHTFSDVITDIKTDHHLLLEQTEKQKTFLEAMTSEYGKRQEESEQMVERLGLLGAQVESARSSGTYHSIAIGGLFVLLLLSILLGYQYFSNRLGGFERDISQERMNASENYMTRDEIEKLMSGGVAQEGSAYDSLAVEELIKQQEAFEQRLDEFEQQIAASIGSVAGGAADRDRSPVGQTEALRPSTVDVKTEQRLQRMEVMLESLRKEFGPRIEKLDAQNRVHLSSQDEMTATINQMATTLQGLKSEYQQLGQQAVSQDGWQALRNRGGYTIQLIGVSNKESIAAFANKHGLQGELAYIGTEREGSAWYILLHGTYDTYTEAANALETLPESLKSQQPWIRKMPDKGTINRL